MKHKKMFLFFSHTLNEMQKSDAEKSFGIEEFVVLPENLQKMWSEVPSDLASLREYAAPFFLFVEQNMNKNDIALIQGDFGMTYLMVSFVHSKEIKAVYATTTREVVEFLQKNGSIVKESIFKHRRFREYE